MDINSLTPQAARDEAKRRMERRAKGLPLHDDVPAKVQEAKPAPVFSVHHTEKAAVSFEGEACHITLYGPARTKKNSLQWLGKQSPAYKTFLADVLDQLKEFPGPLSKQPYNLAARFYVDHYGERADLIGLLQGLADALQAARVVTDDKLFRGLDRSRFYPTPNERYRVEITISPLTITELER